MDNAERTAGRPRSVGGAGQEACRSAAGEILLTREESALCLGLANGVVENLEQDESKAD